MRVNARLNVVEGHVVCPRTAKPSTLEHCQACRELTHVEVHDDTTVVLCHPEVGSFAAAIDRLARPAA